MSLYNMLHGVNPNAGALLAALELSPGDLDRPRDVSFGMYQGEVVVQVFCRYGGNNRESCPNSRLITHPLFIADHDDDFDSMYAHFYLKLPEEVKASVAEQGLKLEDLVDPESLEDKTNR